MPSHLSFSQHLVGHATSLRPPFLYAYSGMWLHWLVAGGLGLLLTELDALYLLSSMAVASFALGLVIYALRARAYPLCINAFSYAASMATPFAAGASSAALLTVALIASLVSTHVLFAREYRLYQREAGAEGTPPLPTWVAAGTATLVLSLFVFALALMGGAQPSGS